MLVGEDGHSYTSAPDPEGPGKTAAKNRKLDISCWQMAFDRCALGIVPTSAHYLCKLQIQSGRGSNRADDSEGLSHSQELDP